MSNLQILKEIFDEVENAKDKKAKVAALHKASDPFVKQILSYTFDPKIKWLVPEGTPPFKAPTEDANFLRQRLRQEMKNLPHFLNIGPYPNLKTMKRESMFIQLLETIHPEDAKMICYIKDNRKLPYKSVTRKLVEEAFPMLAEKWK